MTGLHDADRVQSGFSTRPQIVFSRHADRLRAMSNLIAGLLQEAGAAKLIDLFLWSDMAGLVDASFNQRAFRGVVMLDPSVGPDVLFRQFSQTRRNDIRRAIKCGFLSTLPRVVTTYLPIMQFTSTGHVAASCRSLQKSNFKGSSQRAGTGSCFSRAITTKS